VTDNVCKDAQEAHDRQGNPLSMEIEDSDYRSYLLTAIDSLPDDQRRVVTMLLQDIPIDSKDETTITIVKTLGCSEKTVRNRRDRAYDALRKALDKETIT
jgi:DNA-directed RNA polymerase specialized sigma24 family protein